MEENSSGSNTEGKVWVKNGKVYVKDPAAGGDAPTVCPGENVEVSVNGRVIVSKTSVSTKDVISIVPKEVPPKNEINIRLDKNKMHVYLSVRAVPGKRYYVEDIPPVQNATISAADYHDVTPAVPSIDDIRKELTSKGVTYGIDSQAIIQALVSRNGEEHLVAQGTEPTPGTDAKIDILFEEGYLEKSIDEMWVDHLDYGTIASVGPGEILARRVPPVRGKPGMDVCGKKIEPPEPKDTQLKAGKGVEIRNGTEAVATIRGRPQLKGTRVFVSPVYTIPGDVDKTTGNINFKGDLVIQGSVTDGMKVMVDGKVTVEGHATHCSIEAGGDVIIKRNVVSGSIKAGGKRIHLYSVRDLLVSVLSSLEEIFTGVEQLIGNPKVQEKLEYKKYGPGAILKILLDTKYANILHQYKKLNNVIDSLSSSEKEVFLHEEFQEVFSEMGRKLSGLGPLELKSREDIESLYNRFKAQGERAAAEIEGQLTDKSCLTVNYVQHSTLEATGDVVITGKGGYNVTIKAGGSVTIKDKKGFLRGGEIIAQEDVHIFELGSIGGAPTRVEVPAGREVHCAVVHPGVVIKTGGVVKSVGTRVGDIE